MPWSVTVLLSPSSPNCSHSGIPHHQPATHHWPIYPFSATAVNTHLDTFNVFHPNYIPSPVLTPVLLKKILTKKEHTPNNVVMLVFTHVCATQIQMQVNLHKVLADICQSVRACNGFFILELNWSDHYHQSSSYFPWQSPMFLMVIARCHQVFTPVCSIHLASLPALLLCWSLQYGGQLRNRSKYNSLTANNCKIA